MRRWPLIIRLIAATAVITISSVAMPLFGMQASDSAAQPPFRVYSLKRVPASEARKMLLDLSGDLPRNTRFLADDERHELIVTGPESVQKLASELVDQLNAEPTAQAHSKQNVVIRFYACPTDQLLLCQRTLSASLSEGSRVTIDRNSGRLVIAATEDEHIIAARILSESVSRNDQRTSQVTNESIPSLSFDKSTGNTQGSNREGSARIVSGHSGLAGQTSREDNSEHALRFRFQNITPAQASTAVRRLLGKKVVELSNGNLSFSAGSARSVTMTFDQMSRSCLLEGSRDLVVQFETLLRQFDDARSADVSDQIRFVSMRKVDPLVLNRAIQLWKQSQSTLEERPSAEPIPVRPGIGAEPAIPDTGAEQGSLIMQPAIRPASYQEQARFGADEQEATPGSPPDLRRPSSDVTIEPLPDLDVLILRGRDPDVEEITRIIQEIERLSAETAPEIEVVYLQNVQGEALDQLIEDVLEDLTDPLQGRVSITPLVKPNALLLIGWGEAVAAAKKLIARLDEAVAPQTQMQIFSLKHAAAAQVESTVTEFLNNRGGLAPEVRITADPRTNSVMVNAAPRDMQEVVRMIQKLDAPSSASVNQARIYQLKNALAADVAQTITSAILAARGGTGGQRTAALEMLMVGPDGHSVMASGLLDEVKLTPDARTNRIFITGPPDSVPLVEELIRSLDESPAASAQIKVFQITNGDATDLVQILRSLFPEQAAVSNVPQLATAEGENALVPVRFSVDIRTNSIIATGAAGDLRIIEVLLLRLDEADSQERVNKVYRLKNSPALDVANAVSNFLRSERIVNQAAPGRQNPFTQIESEVVVVPEPVGNALIISATPRYFEQIMELIEGLDAQPPQVMIQVILAEVELENLHEFGVELGLQDSLLFDRSLLGSLLTPGYDFNGKPLGNANTPASLDTRGKVGGQATSHFSLGRTNNDTGFGGLVLSASSENVSVLLRAMNQSRNMEILSRPQIMTLDNQPAFIQVGQRVPRIVGTSINQVGQVNTVELENVGLILGVTPRISPEGMVVMEIDAEKSEVGPEIEGIPVSVSADGEVIRSPRVDITTAQTTVSAASGQTIVIGGLITSNNSSISRRVPWLSDVPLVGNLFRFDGSANSRKELLIILTPHVVRGQEEGEYIKQVEMARMSWISCDIFDWMNTTPGISGQLDSAGIQTIYPDQTPGIGSLTVPAEPILNPAIDDQIPELQSVDENGGGEIQQMRFRTKASPKTRLSQPSKRSTERSLP
ncbi:MAG: hypothetical protein JNL58_19110 [Planctomyces sp.]|nr:hypothetical protein [Planctomyces sp.]